MRAVLSADPSGGAGYGILQIFDIGNVDITSIIIRRLSDGKTLASDGWRKGEYDIQPRRIEAGESHVSLWFGPEVIDDLNIADQYELVLPGFCTASIDLESLRKSEIVTPNGAGAWPPPPEYPQEAPETGNEKIYEGVEATPLDSTNTDVSAMPTGVVNMPNAKKEKNRTKGCFLLMSVAFILWAAGAWLLWHWSINMPVQPDREESAPFELLPRAEGS